jgi:hypothetical protein
MSTLNELLNKFTEKFITSLPGILAGLLLLVVGWAAGWFVKRITIRLCSVLHLERFMTRFRWGEDFSKGDVRYGFYAFFGNIAFITVFLIFMIFSFEMWDLTILSSFLERGISLLPKILISLFLFGFGWLIASASSNAVQKALRRDNIPRANLAARFLKAEIILFFSAMALAELDVARDIVVIGFVILFITMNALAVILTALGGKAIIHKIFGDEDEKK